MITYEFTKESYADFQKGIVREWALTNGIGGYAGSSLIGAHNRTHQGYLIASLHPPIDRYLVFSKINETIAVSANEHTPAAAYSFETSQHKVDHKTVYKNGQEYLTHFCYDGNIHYTYEAGDIRMQKSIGLKRGENTCAVFYEITNNGPAATLSLVPLFNFREHSGSSRPEDLNFKTSVLGNSLCLIPKNHPDTAILFQVSDGIFEENDVIYDIDMQLQTEVDLETDGLDCHFCPVQLHQTIPAHAAKKLSVLCSVVSTGDTFMNISADTACSILAERKRYTASLYQRAGYSDDFANRLVLAADQFLAYRSSTGLKTVLAGLPWFTDWGRDTMIAFTGLTLCTGRKEDAKEILLTFSRYIRHGIVPNMFPDDNTPPLYNTADASLWYFYAVWQYLQYYHEAADITFIREEIYPHLTEIITAYKNGTDFCIYMEEDGLIHAGSGLDQITWMDVRVGEWVVTPRHGKPVEINALWYNALKVMETLTRQFFPENEAAAAKPSITADDYHTLAEKTKRSFGEKFWKEDTGCLYDVVDGDEPDDHLRPNQIYAVSLPFTMLTSEQEARIVAFAEKALYVGCGLRSLTTDHADYHGIYCGSLPKRDAAYHQGTAWGFLLGGFLTAYLKVHAHSPESIAHAQEMLIPVKNHLFDNGCIGSISEIFDGDAPHTQRGCYAQAWSVGEVLRAYVQDILPYLS